METLTKQQQIERDIKNLYADCSEINCYAGAVDEYSNFILEKLGDIKSTADMLIDDIEEYTQNK